MTSWFKNLILFSFIIIVLLSMIAVAVLHETNVTATQEVSPTLNSIQVGEARLNSNGTVDKEALITNFLLDTIEAQKQQDQNLKISYVFLDEDGNVTEDEDKINSIQFKVDILDKTGKTISSSEQRVRLSEQFQEE